MRETVASGLMLTVVYFISLSSVNAGVAVMSIDLGGEFMKIAIVKPGVPMEIVLNKESKRKSPTLVAFRDGERQFGNLAENTAVKFPAKAFAYLPLIVGRHYDDPQVEQFRKRFPYYTMEKDEERGTILFRTDDNSLYSVEELLGMILDQARDYAQDFAEQEIKDAVITVPSYFNQAERRAVLASAQMVGINVLQLMSDNAAVALNYGVFRRNNFNSTMQYYMFYDMGATSTTATIVGYNVVKTKEGTRTESNPQLTIKGVGFDRSLGGLEITLRLRIHLAKAFDDQKKTTLKVEENTRAMGKLLKESERVKKVLSANADHHAQVEGLLDEKDFRHAVTRAELEHLSEDLFERLTKPIEDALRVSEITLPEISEVILMGGATRMPKVQEVLVKYLGRSDLGKSINTDEAAAMGAVYQAAYLGKGFKVKKFGVREGNVYPINVEFEKQKSDDSDEPARVIKRTLFGRMNPYPQRKVMTFNKHTKDFGFNVSYANLDFLTEEDRKSFGSLLIGKYNLMGVADALTKNKDLADSKGIKAHFHMDNSGLLSLDKVESIFEKNDTEAEKEASTWSKLGSAIGGLFGGVSKTEDTKVEDSSDELEAEPSPESESTDSSSEKTEDNADQSSSNKGTEPDSTNNEEEEKKVETPEDSAAEAEDNKEEKASAETEKPKEEKEEKDKEKTEDKKEKVDEEKTQENKTEKADGVDKKEDQEKKVPKIVNIKEEIKSEMEVMDVLDLSEDRFKQAKKRLSDLRKADQEKVELEKSQNELESFIFDMQDKLSQELYEQCSTAEERDNLQAKLAEASDWLYETENAKKADFTDKLKSLRDLAKPVSRRVFELSERPKALAALKDVLNQTSVFMETVKNLTTMPEGEDAIFTPVEMETMEKLINETSKWRDDILKEQDKLKASEEPVLLVDDVGQKIASLDREMRYLINKAKNYKPKAKPKAETKATEDNETSTKAEDSKTPSEGDEEVVRDDSKSTTEGEETTKEDSKNTEEDEAQQAGDGDVPPIEERAAETDESKTKETEEKKKAEEEKQKTDKVKPEDDDGVERTSSGKRRPKQKRKGANKDQNKPEEILELDAAADTKDTSDNAQTDKATHTEL